MPTFRETCAAIKTALDSNGVIAPGRYGIGAAIGSSDRKTDHEEVTMKQSAVKELAVNHGDTNRRASSIKYQPRSKRYYFDAAEYGIRFA